MSIDKLERCTERSFYAKVKKDGFICKKGRGIVGWPDREVYLNNGHMFFLELKKLGKSPNKIQAHVMKSLKELGHHVFWTDSIEEAKRIYEAEKVFANGLQKKGGAKRS